MDRTDGAPYYYCRLFEKNILFVLRLVDVFIIPVIAFMLGNFDFPYLIYQMWLRTAIFAVLIVSTSVSLMCVF